MNPSNGHSRAGAHAITSRGFTLIEVMAVVALLGLYPLVADYFPGLLMGIPYGFDTMIESHVFRAEGMMGITTKIVAEIVLGVLLAVGLFRVPVAWIALAVNTVSTLGSWRQILDPWGWLGLTEGGAHLFLASIVIMAANVVIVMNARVDTLTLDRVRGRPDAS